MMNQNQAILQKTRELCQTILDQPEVHTLRQQIQSFLADEPTRSQYHALMRKGQMLHEKQQSALSLTHEEVADFERDREALLNNPIARGFLDAQEQLQQVRDSIVEHVAKTLEWGRVPEPEELDSCGCGHGCGCH